jgi:hypothetical protein
MAENGQEVTVSGPPSPSKVLTHTRGYHEIVQSAGKKDLFTQQDMLALMAPHSLPTISDIDMRLNHILSTAQGMKSGANRLELIASVCAFSIYKAKVKSLQDQSIPSNEAKSLARAQMKEKLGNLFPDTDGYLKKKIIALEFLRSLCEKGMDVLLVKAVTFKNVMTLNSLDKEKLLRDLRIGGSNWMRMDDLARSTFKIKY